MSRSRFGTVSLSVVASTCLLFASCGGHSTIGSTASELIFINVTPDNVSLTVGATAQLKATGVYSDGHSSNMTAGVVWSLNHPTIADFQSKTVGELAGIAPGTCTVTATIGTITGTAAIAVTRASDAPVLTSIAVSPTTVSLETGAMQQLVATGTYNDHSTAMFQSGLTWTSSDAAVATVNAAGLVSAIAVGQATITAAIGNIVSAPVDITVTSPVVSMPSGSMTPDCHPVINEIQPGEAGDPSNEFIEIFNPCAAAVDVTNWTVYYRVSGGTEAHTLVMLGGTMTAGAYLVLGYISSSGTGYKGLADYAYTSIALSGTSGGVNLAMPATETRAEVSADHMSYGSGTNVFTDGEAAPYSGDTNPPHSVARKSNGVTTGDNSKDFAETATPTPGAANIVSD